MHDLLGMQVFSETNLFLRFLGRVFTMQLADTRASWVMSLNSKRWETQRSWRFTTASSGIPRWPKLEIASATVGIGVLVVTAGLMVWDIFTAEHKCEHKVPVVRVVMSDYQRVGASG